MKILEARRSIKGDRIWLYALVKGSTGVHTVSRIVDPEQGEKVLCTCIGYRTHGTCKHIQLMENVLQRKNGLGRWFKMPEIYDIDEYIKMEKNIYRSSLKALNDLFNNKPYSSDAITLIYGKPKVGKSLLILQEAIWLQMQGKNVLIIDTEGSLRESAEHWVPIFRRRFTGKGKPGKLYVTKILTLEELAKFMGKKITVITKGDERKGGKAEFAIIGDTVNRLEEYIGSKRIDVVFVDSITAPIRTAIPSAQQNNPAKSDAEGFLMGRLMLAMDRYDVAVVVTAHASFNPANPYETGAEIRGGVAVHHFAKNVIYVDKRDKSGMREYRRLWLVRYGSNKPEWSDVGIVKITELGYVDVDIPVTELLTDSELKRLGIKIEKKKKR